jgi:hypothetical protein
MFTLGVTFLAAAAEKPSPFIARQSAPAVAPVAPVSPVVSTSILKSLRSRPVVAVSGSVAPTPQHPHHPEEPPPPPPSIPAPEILKTVVPPVPEVVVARIKPPQVGEIVMGATRNEVVSKLGNPASAISMSEDGRFLESLRYEWKGNWTGTIRLADGRVTRIDQP